MQEWTAPIQAYKQNVKFNIINSKLIINMLPLNLFILFLLLIYTQSSFLCSALCSPGQCSGPTEADCSGCPADWSSGSGTCTLDSGSGYVLIGKSSDMVGGTSSIELLPAISTITCGDFTYFGNEACNNHLQVSMPSGISSAHYGIQVIVWVLFYNDSTWTSANNIAVALGANSISRAMSSYDGQVQACQTGISQTYYRLAVNFNHINSTSSAITIDISSDVDPPGSCTWGFKEAIILAQPCHSSCTECSGSADTSCYSCISSQFLSGNTCSNACLTGYGAVTGSNVCVLCDIKCITCSQNSTYCSSCKNATNQGFLYNSTCVNPCPASTFSDSSTQSCTSCISHCASCSDSTTCNTCEATYYWHNGICYSSCPNGTYANGLNCTLCDSKCQACSTSSSNCSSCAQTGANIAYLYNSTSCMVSCPDGTYSSSAPNLCNTCDAKCITCEVLSTNCSSCTLSGGSKAYLLNSACVASCPDGTYSSSTPNLCNTCDVKCLTCDVSSTNCSSCTLSGGNMAYLLGSACITTCPNSTYPSSNPNICNACDLKCILCEGSSTNCSSCTLSGSNIAYLNNLACETNCPIGTFSSSNPNVCSACDQKCIACDVLSTNCSSCTLSGSHLAYLYNSECVSTCPGGTFSSNAPNLCNSCDLKCTSCTGSLSTQCSACLTGNFLSSTTCASSCLSQYGQVSNSSICVYCSLYCTSCYGADDNCSACTTSGAYEAFLDSSISSYKKCVVSCTITGFFANSVNHLCDSCSSSCLTCSSSASNCLSCNTGDGWLNYACYVTCPNDYYKNGANCTICDSKCSICNIAATNCTVCSSTAYLLVYTCYSTCPDPYYADSNAGAGPNLCLPCNSQCTSCTGASNSQCSSCSTNFTLSGTTCDATCLAGYGASSIIGVCVLCVNPCTECNLLATNCTLCPTSPSQQYLLTISGSSTCVINCPIGYYIDALNCSSCPTGCSDCSSSSNCYSCNTTYLYYNAMCYSTCPTGTFQQTPQNCTACYKYCSGCSYGPDNCTSCFTNGTNKSFLLEGNCFPTCPAPYYGYTGNQTCRPCNSACATCNGGSAGNCYQCNYPYILSGSTCAAACVAGYGVTSNPNTCVRCNSTCTQCAYINTNCSACQSTGNFTAFLYDDLLTYPKCLMICPAGTIPINSTRNCTPCTTGCATCNNSISSCQTCSTGYGIINETCYSPCPDGYFLSSSSCLICSPYCLLCSGANTTCSTCVINGSHKSYLHGSSCVASCPNGHYQFDNSSFGPTTCNVCDAACQQCSGNDKNCSLCSNGSYLYLNSCLSICPSGFFPYNETRTCNDTSTHLSMSMEFLDSLNEELAIDLDFTNNLDQATFPKQTFQTITFSDPTITLSLFHVAYSWINSHSYRIFLTPISNIYLYNVTVHVTTMALPPIVYNSSDGFPFSQQNYNRSTSINWFLIKGSGWSKLEATVISSLSTTSESISSITTLPGMQEVNKAGLISLVFPGAQLTSTSILINSVPPQNSYEGARFWGHFVFFEVPGWEKNKNQSKAVVATSADSLAKGSRLLGQRRDTFAVNQIYWRFNRTGFTTFFIFDCYMQMVLIVFSWILLLISKRLENRVKQSIISKLYSIFHCLHEITIFYLALGLVLQLLYFDITSVKRVVSLIICLCFNLYYLLYQLYIYYDIIKYPLLPLGSNQYRKIAKKYGYFLKNIRYEEYEEDQDIEKWSPSHLFRPYNYHLLSFYKKYLMIFAVALFYQYPLYAAGTLVAIEIFELVRFYLSWPFASRKRNLVRFTLELVTLVFFITVLLQTFYMQQISKNDMRTIVSATNAFYLTGWISFICIFVFNLAFIAIFIYDICCFFSRSNTEAMRTIRRDFYYQKILKYENCTDTSPDTDMLDNWVIKGDLNENWIDDKEIITPDLDITVEKYTINKMGDGFTVQMEKTVDLEMKHPNSVVYKQKMKVREQIHGTVGLTKQNSPTFYNIIKSIYQDYDPTYQADFLTIKTIAKIESSKYQAGESIKLSEEPHIQVLALQYSGDEKKTHKLAVPLKGFPINPELFNSLIYSKTLSKKYLY